MTSFDISNNDIKATGCKALAGALKGNQVMKELNVADNQLTLKADAKTMNDVDISGVTTLADVISGMGAMTALHLSDNAIGGHFKSITFIATPEGVTSLHCICHTHRSVLILVDVRSCCYR